MSTVQRAVGVTAGCLEAWAVELSEALTLEFQCWQVRVGALLGFQVNRNYI